jgi:hypothetical protein
VLRGEGDQTLIVYSGSDVAIVVGASLGEDGAEIHDLKIQASGAASGTKGIQLNGSSDAVVSNVVIEGLPIGMTITGFTGAKISDITIINPEEAGIADSTNTADVQLINITIRGDQTRYSNMQAGISLNTDNVVLNNITISGLYTSTSGSDLRGIDLTGDGIELTNFNISDLDTNAGLKSSFGLLVNGDNCKVANGFIDDMDNSTTAANGFGSSVVGDNNTLSNIGVVNCSGTGMLIDTTADKTQISSSRSQTNGTNFTDSGTNTTASVEDT